MLSRWLVLAATTAVACSDDRGDGVEVQDVLVDGSDVEANGDVPDVRPFTQPGSGA